MRRRWGILIGTPDEIEEMMDRDTDRTLEVDWSLLPEGVDFTVDDLLKARRRKPGWSTTEDPE